MEQFLSRSYLIIGFGLTLLFIVLACISNTYASSLLMIALAACFMGATTACYYVSRE